MKFLFANACFKDAVSGTVDVCEMMGSEVHLHVSALGRDVIVIVPTVDIQGHHNDVFALGTKVNLTFGGNVCHVFDAEGKNLIK